jgi:integral membrane sensor domain MASE1
MLVAAAVYFVMARIGLELAVPPAFKASAVWPASGVALAAVIYWGRSVWPGIWCGAFLGNVLDFYFGPAHFSFAVHAAIAAAIASGSALQAIVGAHLLERFIGLRNPLNKRWDIIRFFIIAGLACLLASTFGVASLIAVGITPFERAGFSWITWWIGDVVGIAVITPFLLVWLGDRSREKVAWLEGAMFLGIVAAVAFLAFAGRPANSALSATLAYLAVPLIVVSTFKFGQRGATTSLLVFSAVAVWGTATGNGPFIYDTTAESLLSLQAFVGIIALTALSLAAVLQEQRSQERDKAEAISELQRVLTEVSTLRSMIPLCASCKKVRNDTGAWEQLERFMHVSYAASFSHGMCPDCEARAIRDDLEMLDGA